MNRGTCRVCHESDSALMVKYSVRHYAHAECAMAKWGVEFLSRLTDWQCTQFPYFVAQKYGADAELVRRCERYEAEEKARAAALAKTGS